MENMYTLPICIGNNTIMSAICTLVKTLQLYYMKNVLVFNQSEARNFL